MATWNAIKVDTIRQFILRTGIDVDPQLPAAQLIPALDNLHITVQDYFSSQAGSAGNLTVDQRLALQAPKPTLASQGSNEDVSAFIQRADQLFAQSRVADYHRNGFLLEAAQPSVKAYASSLMDTGITDYNVICERLKAAFSKSFVQLLAEFRATRRQPGETFVIFGNRLKQLYQAIHQFSNADMNANAAAIQPHLLEQLLQHERTTVRGYTFLEFQKNRQIEFHDLCLIADLHEQAHLPVHRQQVPMDKKPSEGFRNKSSNSMWCSHHRSTSHNTKDCRALLGNSTTRPNSGRRPQSGSVASVQFSDKIQVDGVSTEYHDPDENACAAVGFASENDN